HGGVGGHGGGEKRGEWRLEDGDSGGDVDGGGGSCSSGWEMERSGGCEGGAWGRVV
nr:hypothetical protein [Tanacetum cinerariifolium]